MLKRARRDLWQSEGGRRTIALGVSMLWVGENFQVADGKYRLKGYWVNVNNLKGERKRLFVGFVGWYELSKGQVGPGLRFKKELGLVDL